jgi:predicted murein hydrolase (TIGR00659 family)
MILFSLLITILLYSGAKHFYKRKPKIYLSPLVTAPILIVTLLLAAKIPYDTYNSGAKWLSLMLQPATIGFAVPLYKYRATLKKHAVEIILSVLFGSVVAIISSVWLAEAFSINTELVDSLIPRSVTTPIAMDISEMLGGIPSITAVFVIITGLLGSLLGPFVIRFFKIETEIGRGVLFGTGAHAVGTSKAFEFSSATGTISSLSMILAAIITVCAAPFIVPLLNF